MPGAGRGLRSLYGLDPRTRACIEAGRSLTAADYIFMTRRWAKLIAQADARLASGEVLVLPTVPIMAPPIAAMAEPAAFQRVNGLLSRRPQIANLPDLPATSLPLPVPPGRIDADSLARPGPVAAAVERSLGP